MKTEEKREVDDVPGPFSVMMSLGSNLAKMDETGIFKRKVAAFDWLIVFVDHNQNFSDHR